MGKTRHVRFSGNLQFHLELLGPHSTVYHLPGELRGAQPWNRPGVGLEHGVDLKNGHGTPANVVAMRFFIDS